MLDTKCKICKKPGALEFFWMCRDCVSKANAVNIAILNGSRARIGDGPVLYDICGAYSMMNNAYKGSPDMQALIETKFDEIMSNLNNESVGYCVSTFVNAELDTTNTGNVGFGRNSASPPRLGGYINRNLRSLDQESLWYLSRAIRRLLLQGYIGHRVVFEMESDTPKRHDCNNLMDTLSYLSGRVDASSMPHGIGKAFDTLVSSGVMELSDCIHENRLSPRWFFARTKMAMIMKYYANIGFVLRNSEMA